LIKDPNGIDEIDRKILNIIQSRFPITSRPFLEVGEVLGLTEQNVLQRVRRLKQLDIIRRIGGNFDSKKLGFIGTLCAAKVPQDKIEKFNEVINSYPGVTHNYSRNHEYNIWFTFIGESKEEIERALSEISKKTGIQTILNLPAKKTFKIRVDFEI
jgi:DNA-binding Lrp family transcriptional regulator